MTEEQKWLISQKSHKLHFSNNFFEKIPVEILYSPTNSISITINSLKLLSFPKFDPNKEYKIQILSTLFYNVSNEFIGRTVPSKISNLTTGKNEVNSNEIIEFLRFYSFLPLDDLEIICEFLIYEVDIKSKILLRNTIISCGFSRLKLKGDITSSKIYQGSPKILLLKPNESELQIIENAAVNYQISITDAKILPKFIEGNCLFGSADFVPGIGKSELKYGTIYISNCNVFIHSRIEEIFREQYLKFFESKGIMSLVIKERRLRVGCHNQWKFVNSTKLQNSISLTDSGDGLMCNGILLIDNVPMCEGIALIFQLEYIIQIIYNEGNQENKYTIISELVNPLNLSNEIVQETDMSQIFENIEKIGVDGDNLWAGYSGIQIADEKIKINCHISSKPKFEEKHISAEKNPDILNADLIEEHKRIEEMFVKQDTQLRELQTKREKELLEKQHTLELKAKELEKKSIASPRFGSPNENMPINAESNPEIKTEVKENKISVPDIIKPIASFKEQKNENENMKISQEILEENNNDLTKKNNIQNLMEIEINDQLKASTILIEILAIKPIIEFPRKVIFSNKFYSFPQIWTECVSIRQKIATEDGLIPLQICGSCPNLTNTSTRDPLNLTLRIQYDFDPSLNIIVPADYQHEDFCKYMLLNSLIFDIYDSESQIYFGSFSLHLCDIIRKGNLSFKSEFTCEIICPLKQRVLGYIILKIENIGRFIGNINIPNPEKKSNNNRIIGKTKLVSKPILNKNKEELSDISNIKSKLILDYQMGTLEKLNELKMKKEMEWEVEKYRAISRDINLSQICDKFKQNLPQSFYMLGQLQLLLIVVQNPYKTKETFKIQIEDSLFSEKLISIPQISLVTNPLECEFYSKMTNCNTKITDWTTKFLSNSLLNLESNEQITLVVKILVLEPPPLEKRKLSINIYKNTDNSLIFSKSSMLIFYPTYYNAEIMTTAQENSPLIFEWDAAGYDILAMTKSILCSDTNIKVEIKENIDNSHKSVIIQTKMEFENKDFLIFFFSEEFYYSTIFILHCVIKPYEKLEFNAICGEIFEQNLLIPKGIFKNF